MKHQIILILVLVTALSSCNPRTENNGVSINENKEAQTELAPSIDVTGCYMHVRDRDTIIARLQQHGMEVTGTLKFDNYQIDGSSGKLYGIMEGDILKLKYDFHAEGMNSLMDIYFKYNNASLNRGVGDMKTIGNTSIFIDQSSIKYPNETILKKINCEALKLLSL